MNTISLNYQTILNYFDNRSTNAAAESFNAKIKAFRGVKNKEFFYTGLQKFMRNPQLVHMINKHLSD